MQRRRFLKAAGTAIGGLALGVERGVAADTKLEPGTWYDATITDTVDGDTFDVELDSDGTAYTVRALGIDTPEKTGNTRYDKVEEWEGIEDASYLETWGNNASEFAATELPVGTHCQIALDAESEEMDQYGRLLAKIRYDRTGDGVLNTVYNKYTIEQGYARVYSASMSTTDEYWDAEHAARANGRNLWQKSDPSNTPEVRDNDVAQTFHPNTSSIRTTSGALADTRVPIWAEPDATQTLDNGAVTYEQGSIPLVGVDAANNLAMLGGQPIQEDHDDAAAQLEHFVFLTNLIDALTAGSRSGLVLVDGGHHQFTPEHSCSAEDTVYYQRYLEGQGIELAGINTVGDTTGPTLTDARAIIITSPADSVTAAEVTALQDFIANGGAVILMGSSKSTAAQRSNLDTLAGDLGSDLRLNADEVTDDTNNVGRNTLLSTSNFNTADFSLWRAYSDDGTDSSYIVSVDQVQRTATTLNGEYVDLRNDDAADVELTGWTMVNEAGATYTFPDGFTLAAGSTVRIHTGSGTDTSSDLYWGAAMFRWDNDADRCAMYDSTGDLAADATWAVPDVIIPTINADGATLTDEYVDLQNVSGSTVDMSGWTLEDDGGHMYTIPSGFSLTDGGTVRIHTGDGTDSDTDLYWGRGAAVWNNDGDTASLSTATGDLVQTRTYPAPYSLSIPTMVVDGATLNEEHVDVRNDGASVLDMTGFTLQDEAGATYTFPDSFTLGAGATVRVHTGDGTDTSTDLYWGRGSPVWNDSGDTASIYDDNEVLAVTQSSDTSNSSTVAVATVNASGSTLNEEYVDFDNTGSTEQELTGWYVEDAAGHRYTFPDGFTLASGTTVRLHTGSGTDTSSDLYWGSGTYIWNDGGDTVSLFEADGTLHTKYSY